MEISRRGPSRRSEVAPFLAMDVLALAAEEEARRRARGDRVVHMEVGQPSSPAPKAAREAVRAALDQPLGYTVALGLPALRARIARLYRDWCDLDIDPARIIVTTGSSAGFQLAFLTLFEAGDRLAMGDPGYPSYRNIAAALGLEPQRLETTRATRYQPSPELLQGAGDVDGLLIASPANPTGSILDASALRALMTACAERGVAFISDEIYHGLHYGARAVSALELATETGCDPIVVNSFSKYFSMTGWRIGWLVAPENLVRPMERLAQNLYICPPHISQIAALAALDADKELEAHRDVYAANRRLLLEALPKLGFGEIAPCDGAFYLYADIDDLLKSSGVADSRAWCRRLLLEFGVAVTPGVDFDPARGERTVRFSFARDLDEVRLGIDRLARWTAA